MEFIIREATKKDLPLMAVLFRDAFRAAPWCDHWTLETAQRRLGTYLDHPRAFSLSLWEGDTLLGFLLGEIEQYDQLEQFLLREIAVSPARRGQGIGKLLYETAENRLKQEGIQKVELVTLSAEKTRGFYEALGFHVERDMIIMKKRLSKEEEV